MTTSFYQTILFIAKNQNLPKSSLFKCYDSNLHWWLSPKASRSQSSANRELSIFRRDDPCVDHKIDPDLHELKGPDGSEEVLLWLVARHVLLQRFGALSELKISKYRNLTQMWSFGIVWFFRYLMNSGINLLIFAVKDVLDKLDVICPHSHLQAATKTTSHYKNDLFCYFFCKCVFYLNFFIILHTHFCVC